MPSKTRLLFSDEQKSLNEFIQIPLNILCFFANYLPFHIIVMVFCHTKTGYEHQKLQHYPQGSCNTIALLPHM